MSEFILSPTLSAKAEAFVNEELIADIVLPKVPVRSEAFYADYFPVGVFAQTRDNRVGRADSPKIINVASNSRIFSTEDYALDAILYNYDKERNEQALDGRTTNIQWKAANTLALASAQSNCREVRVANLAQAINSYSPGNRITLSGPSQWSDPTSRPLDDITRAVDNSLVPYNIFVMGMAAFSALKVHPQIVGGIFKNGARDGIVDQAAMETLFGIKIVIGKAFVSTHDDLDITRSNATLKRAWGNHASLIYINPLAQAIAGLSQYSFGYTPQVGGTRISELFNGMMGARGALTLRILDVEIPLITAKFCGFLFRDVAPPTTNLSISNLM